MPQVVDQIRAGLSEIVAGRPSIIVGQPAAETTRMVRALRELGAPRCLVLATGHGTGTLPHPSDADVIIHEIAVPHLTAEAFAVSEVLRDPPPTFLKALEEFDPDERAMIWCLRPRRGEPTFAGRPMYGVRPSAWEALEDKTLVDEVFDKAGISRPRSLICSPNLDELRACAEQLDSGAGTVWSGDIREVIRGAAEFVHWVRDEEGAQHAYEFFAGHCDRVRVSPFIEGIPCSAHGIITGEGIAVFRPVENFTFRTQDLGGFFYAGVGTYYDPPESERNLMQESIRRVGKVISEQFGYRGGFTVDGIVSENGWIPTEINARLGVGIGYVAAVLPDLPVPMLNAALTAGDLQDIPMDVLEDTIVDAADSHRWANPRRWFYRKITTTQRFNATHDEEGFRFASDIEPVDARITVGPNSTGGFFRATLGDRTPIGPSTAPLVAELLGFADKAFGCEFGELQPPRDVRK